jgi:hypothetical protein
MGRRKRGVGVVVARKKKFIRIWGMGMMEMIGVMGCKIRKGLN